MSLFICKKCGYVDDTDYIFKAKCVQNITLEELKVKRYELMAKGYPALSKNEMLGVTTKNGKPNLLCSVCNLGEDHGLMERRKPTLEEAFRKDYYGYIKDELPIDLKDRLKNRKVNKIKNISDYLYNDTVRMLNLNNKKELTENEKKKKELRAKLKVLKKQNASKAELKEIRKEMMAL